MGVPFMLDLSARSTGGLMLIKLITTTAIVNLVMVAAFGLAAGAFAFYHLGRR